MGATSQQSTPPAAREFKEMIAALGSGPLVRTTVTTLQVNLGKRCNMRCQHCHVEAGPERAELMQAGLARPVLDVLARSPSLAVLDLTGGAPELSPAFPLLVRGGAALGRRVIDRCNLSILGEPGMEALPEFLAAHGVEIIASLPCHLGPLTDRQRGPGAFARAVAGLRRLNAVGYGRPGSLLQLALVHNPLGPTLPPPQLSLESAYRQELEARYGVQFHRLLTITNMPVGRFGRMLRESGGEAGYLELLVAHFNPATVPELMCRSLLSVGWDGSLYDCDFYQACGIGLGGGEGPRRLDELANLDALVGRPVATARHCFACTAGAGSSCSGALQ